MKERPNITIPFKKRELPKEINTPYPMVAVGDLRDVAKKFDPSITEQDVLPFQQQMFTIQETYKPPGTTFYATTTKVLFEELDDHLISKTNKKPTGVVILDKYISTEYSYSDEFKLNISRGTKNELISRTGEVESPELQLQRMQDWISDNDFSTVLFVDDVLARGTTLKPVIKAAQDTAGEKDFQVVTAIATRGGVFRGVECIEESGVIVDSLHYVSASEPSRYSSGLAISPSRDMSVFGGYTSSNDYSFPVCYPHILPYAIARPGFYNLDKRLEVSKSVLTLNSEFVSWIDQRSGEQQTIQSLLDKGFSVPYTTIEQFQDIFPLPKMEERLVDYVDSSIDFLHENIDAIVDTLNN